MITYIACVWVRAKRNYWKCERCGVPYGGNKPRQRVEQPTARRKCEKTRDPNRFTIKRVVPMQAKRIRRRRAEPCAKLGELIELRECETCTGRTQIKVLVCGEFGECTIGKKLSGVACCAGGACPGYEATKRDGDPDDGRSG